MRFDVYWIFVYYLTVITLRGKMEMDGIIVVSF